MVNGRSECPPGFVEVDLRESHSNAREKSKKRFSRPSQSFNSTGHISVALHAITIISICAYVSTASAIEKLCDGCTVECAKTGISVNRPEAILKMEICCRGDSCSTITSEDSAIHDLPQELVLNDYGCDIKFWDANMTVFQTSIQCPAVDECRVVECTVCWDSIVNPTCYPTAFVILIGIGVTSVGALLCCLLTILRQCRKNCGCICNILCACPRLAWMLCRSPSRRVHETVVEQQTLICPRHNPTKRTGVRGVLRNNRILIAILYAVTSASTKIWVTEATEVVSMSAKSENCHSAPNGTWCTINDVTTLTLLPAGQTVTLLIKDANSNLLGVLELKMEALTVNCVPKAEKWLRSYHIESAARKRCPRMGSCKNDYCREVTAESTISELEEFNTSPGVARCADSCSAWWCGCPVPPTVAPFVTGCLFYRYYALPTSNTTYEVFSCPTWEQHIVASISLKIANDSRAVNATLHPGMTYHWDEFSVTPLSVSQAPTPVLSQKFITDGADVALAGELVSDFFDLLQR